MSKTNVSVKWLNELQFVGIDSTKHSLVMSSQDDKNGIGCKPSDLLLIAFAGCTGMDVISILMKKRQDIRSFEMVVTGIQNDEMPHSFQNIEIEYIFKGKGISESAVARAIELSEQKYCSVGTTLAKGVPINRKYTVVESD